MELILENVRCFAGRHTIPIKPLTILLGENSSGKSTFLGALSIVCDPIGFPMQPNFNEAPYSFGGFDTIATYKGGKYGRADFFSLGHRRDSNDGKNASTVLAEYWGYEGRIELFGLKITTPAGNLTLILEEPFQRYRLKLDYSESGKRKSFDFKIDREKIEGRNLHFSGELIVYAAEWGRKEQEESDAILNALEVARFVTPREFSGGPLSIAPIRTKPRRVYDQITEPFTPEGDHIPFILARMLNGYPPAKQKRLLISALERFGKESGLFKEIDVKRLGKKAGDPFQVMVTVSGRPANMLDVGYGVSQALPVVVQSVLLAKERLMLLQQPEVHLHPKAQAALGSFFVDMVVDGKRNFVVETHSDYIVDRIRQEVAKGRLDPKSVVLLFFEKPGIETTIHQIRLDEAGNIIGAPPSYREFFLREELNLLTRTTP